MDHADRRRLFSFLYEVIVHELTSIFGPGTLIPFSVIARCFEITASFSEQQANVLTYAYHDAIYAFGLHEDTVVYNNFLYDEEPMILPKDRSQDFYPHRQSLWLSNHGNRSDSADMERDPEKRVSQWLLQTRPTRKQGRHLGHSLRPTDTLSRLQTR